MWKILEDPGLRKANLSGAWLADWRPFTAAWGGMPPVALGQNSQNS